MNFLEIAKKRQSCRNFDPDKQVSQQQLDNIIEAARLSPSACNGQPYHITLCKGEMALKVAKATTTMGMNKFALEAPIMLVISEMPYVKSAAIGSKLSNNDYRSIDIGILSAYITAEATVQGLDTCILGWLDGKKIQELCSLDGVVRLVIALGYAKQDDVLRPKKRKDLEELLTVIE